MRSKLLFDFYLECKTRPRAFLDIGFIVKLYSKSYLPGKRRYVLITTYCERLQHVNIGMDCAPDADVKSRGFCKSKLTTRALNISMNEELLK
jgi:hypothetical protein